MLPYLSRNNAKKASSAPAAWLLNFTLMLSYAFSNVKIRPPCNTHSPWIGPAEHDLISQLYTQNKTLSKTKGLSSNRAILKWRPHGDSNPGRRRERAVS